MTHRSSRRAALGLIAAGLALPAAARSAPVFSSASGMAGFGPTAAIGGYDAVAYHLEDAAVRGHVELIWCDALWLFATEANRDRFAADPDRWAPRFGGHCAWSMSEGWLASSDPTQWAIHQGALYLQLSRSTFSLWREDPAGHIGRAEAHWARIA